MTKGHTFKAECCNTQNIWRNVENVYQGQQQFWLPINYFLHLSNSSQTEECAVPPHVGKCENLNKISSTLLKYVGTVVFWGADQPTDSEAFVNNKAGEGF